MHMLAAAVVGFLITMCLQPVQSASAQPSGAPIPRLAIHARGIAGEPLPLGVKIEGWSDDAVVIVTGLVPGMTLSTGNALAENEWQVPAADVANTWVGPPTGFVGMVDLVAELHLADTVVHLQPIQLEWVATSTVVAAQVSPATQAAEAISAPQQLHQGETAMGRSENPTATIEQPGGKTRQKRDTSKVTAPTSSKMPVKARQNERMTKATVSIGQDGMSVAAVPGDKATQNASTEPSPEHRSQSQCDYRGCASAYRSFRASDCTYQPYGGRRRLCEKGAPATGVPERVSQVSTVTRSQQCNHEVCARFYKSFDPSDCTYQPYDRGARRICQR
jgi:BA14K-like protein